MSALSTVSIDTHRIPGDTPRVPPLAEGHRVGSCEVVIPVERAEGVTLYAALDHRDGAEVRLIEFLPRGLCRRGADGVVIAHSVAGERDRYLAGLRRFLSLGRTLAHLDEPGLAKVRECWTENGTCYLAASAQVSQRLDTWRRHLSAPPSEGLVWRYADRLGRALRALHAVHCLHLEVSPARIAIAAGPEPVLLEAVSAWRLLDRLNAESRALYRGHGAAPELHSGQTRGDRVGPWTDVYALAASLFWFATGEPVPRSIDRVPGDIRRALERLVGGRYSNDLLAAIDSGLSPQIADRAQWWPRWAQTCRRHAREDDAPDDFAMDASQWSAVLTAAPALQLDDADANDEALEPAGTLSTRTIVRPSSGPAELARQSPSAASLAGSHRWRISWRVLASLAVATCGIFLARTPPVASGPAYPTEPKRITVADLGALMIDQDRRAAAQAGSLESAAGHAIGVQPQSASVETATGTRQAIVAPQPRLASAAGGHVTAALDIGPDGKVTTVALLSSDLQGPVNSEVVRTLLRWQYEATGAAEHATIDLAVEGAKR